MPWVEVTPPCLRWNTCSPWWKGLSGHHSEKERANISVSSLLKPQELCPSTIPIDITNIARIIHTARYLCGSRHEQDSEQLRKESGSRARLKAFEMDKNGAFRCLLSLLWYMRGYCERVKEEEKRGERGMVSWNQPSLVQYHRSMPSEAARKGIKEWKGAWQWQKQAGGMKRALWWWES